MHYLVPLILLLTGLYTAPAAAQAIPGADQVIHDFALQEQATPMRDMPGWAPRRVVVSLPEGMAARMPQLEQMLQAAAGDTELVLDRSPGMAPSAELLQGADAVISLCTRQTLDQASPRLLWLHSYTVGVDGCSGLPPAQIDGRVFTNSKRLMGPAIAEHSMAMLMAISTSVTVSMAALTSGTFR